jgi:hypothetical protein
MLSALYIDENTPTIVLDNAERSAYIGTMTIEERLDGLTQTLELVAGIQKDNEHRMAQLIDTVNRIGIAVESHEHRIGNLEERS